ncbi:hypothetical protein HDU96_009081 [Phlyctochytrium bullatum]|nr:hypothetical protein HDU96_009081 [Phlyctochytrium bullatum]
MEPPTPPTSSPITPLIPPRSSSRVVPASHRFAELARTRPDLSMAQIINSNNYSLEEIQQGSVDLAAPPRIPEHADAVVVGAGVSGLIYAIHLKKIKPDATVVVLERSAQPTYKIGESALSPFTRFCMSHVMSIQYMLRLFSLKEGLDFVHVDESGENTYYHDIGGLDYSFQVERKVSEMLLTLKAQRMGVKVFFGVSVDGRESNLSPELAEKLLHFTLKPSVLNNTPDTSFRPQSSLGNALLRPTSPSGDPEALPRSKSSLGMAFLRPTSPGPRRHFGMNLFRGAPADAPSEQQQPQSESMMGRFSLQFFRPSFDADKRSRQQSMDESRAKMGRFANFRKVLFRSSTDSEMGDGGEQSVKMVSKAGSKLQVFSRLFKKQQWGLSDSDDSNGVPTIDVIAPPPSFTATPSMVQTRVVVDGSGLAHTLGKQLGVETKKFDGIDFDAYWAYFREDMGKQETFLRDFMYSAGNHICMKDGWSWWIRLVSWEKSPRANLMDLITFLLDNHDAGVDEDLIPCIDDLARTFGCTHERVVSIGFTIRTEALDSIPQPPADVVDPEKASENERRFWGIVCKYPVLERILLRSGRYELCQKFYGPIFGTYFARKSMSFYKTRVAGPGWFSMGDAGGFTSPLFSPGINCLALPAAWLAAELSKRYLESGEEVWSEYQEFLAGHLVPGLRNVDKFLYNMFRDGRLFMTIFPIFYGNGLGNISKYLREDYSDNEIGWGNGCGEDIFKELIPQLFPLIEGPSSEPVSDETAEKVNELCEKYRKIIIERYSAQTKYSYYMRHFDDNLQHNPNKLGRLPGEFGARRCKYCHHPNSQERTWCISCSKELPPTIFRPFEGVEYVIDANKLRNGLDACQLQAPVAPVRKRVPDALPSTGRA